MSVESPLDSAKVYTFFWKWLYKVLNVLLELPFFTRRRGPIFFHVGKGGDQNFLTHAKGGHQKKSATGSYKQTGPLPIKNDSSPLKYIKKSSNLYISFTFIKQGAVRSQLIPILHPCMETYTKMASGIFNIMNDGYPANGISQTMCSLNLTITTPIKIQFYDVHFTSKEHTNCPVHFKTPVAERCGESGNSAYPEIEIFPLDNMDNVEHTFSLDIIQDKSVTKMWFWLQLTSM